MSPSDSAASTRDSDPDFDGLIAAIRSALVAHGFHVLRSAQTIGSFYHLARCLGSVLRIEDVRLGASARGAHSPRELGLHTDQHYVDLIGWYCVRAAPEGGATLLVDTRPALDSMSPAERDALSRATMRCPDVEGRDPPIDVPLLRRDGPRDRIYYAAWNVAPLPDPTVNAAFKKFRAAVESAPRIAVRLEAGESLFVDNGRLLHGRGELPTDSPRVLKRFWLEAREPGVDRVSPIANAPTS